MSLASVARAAPLDLGVGLSYVDDLHSDALSMGWDLQVGYELERRAGWSIGWQAQLTQALDSSHDYLDETDMSYSSGGLYLTATPFKGWFYVKGGVVDARYQTITHDQHTAGVGLGAGFVVDYPEVKLHILDMQRVMVGAEGFNMYTISFTVLTTGYF